MSRSTQTYDFVIVGGGSAGCALANRLSADPGTACWSSRPAAPTTGSTRSSTCRRRCRIPIGNRLYDWKYESEPEPYMDGRRVYHARGKVLGGSSSINGMIFQRGNPLDFERWAADQGMESWDYAHCLPYFKRMETCLAGADAVARRQRAAACSSAARRPARCSARSSRPSQQAGYPLTDDVNGYRQEGFAPFDRNVHRGRRLSAARAYLHPVRNRPNLAVETLAMVTGLVTDGNRVTGVDYHRAGRGDTRVARRRGHPVRRRDQLPAAAAARRHRAEGRPRAARHRRGAGPARCRRATCRTTSRSTSSTPASSRSPSAPGSSTATSRGSARSGCSCARGVGASNHFEAGGFIRSNDEVDYPNLMFHFLPIAIRYDGSRPAAEHGYQVHIGPMYSDVRGARHAEVAGPPRAPGAAVQLPLHRDRPPGVDRDGPRRPAHPQPAGVRGVQRRRALARDRRSRPTRRSSTGSPRTPRPRCTRRARRGWASTTWRCSTRRRCGCTASTGCASSTPRRCPTSPTATSTPR